MSLTFSDNLKDLHFHSNLKETIDFCTYVSEVLGIPSPLIYCWYRGTEEPVDFIQQDMLDNISVCLNRDGKSSTQ